MMKKLLIFSIFCLILLTGCSKQDSSSTTEQKAFTGSELATFDGKSGNKCYVAVSGKVYEIKNSNKWVNGVHTESEGQANCGRDLTSVISQAPHGVSILTTSPKIQVVGTLD